MIKYICMVIRAIPSIFACWIKCLHMNRHKEKYPLEVRYARVRKTAIQIARATRCRLHIENLDVITQEHKGRVYIANHLSIFDIVTLFQISEKPIIMISKIENKKVPFLKTVCKALDVIFVNRSDTRQSLRACKEAGELALNYNRDILVFPEGTRSKDGNVHEFKAALSSIVHYSHSDIVPICLTNTEKVMKFKWITYPKINIYAYVFKPLNYNVYLESRKEFNEQIKILIQEKKNEMEKRKDYEYH